MSLEKTFIEGLKEAIAHKQGAKTLRTNVVCSPNVQSIRNSLNLTQTEFATKFFIPLSNVKNWEQGRRTPDQPTSVYLHLISRLSGPIEDELERLKLDS